MNKRIKLSLLVCVGAFALAIAARAQSTLSASYSFEGANWGSSDWSMVGNALYVNDGGLTPPTRLRLTSNNLNQNGAAWLNTTAVIPTTDWTWSIRAENSYPSPGGYADETSMILQTSGTSANVGTGAFNGSGFGTYVAIVLDNYTNATGYGQVEVVTSSGGVIGSFPVGNYLDRGDY